jgi:hypothetical protein
MEPMFLSPPPDFDVILAELREAEAAINVMPPPAGANEP